MALTNDLLLYESRKRAIERVREMQEETRKKVEEGSEADPPLKEDIKEELFGENNYNQSNFQNEGFNAPFYMNNEGQNFRNKKGVSGLLESLFKGNGGALNMLKGQVGEITGPLKGIMDYFDLDSEKIIILLIMWALFSEKQDKTLLLALGYLLI